MLESLPANRRTDLQILQLHGAGIEDRGDHLVIRSPHNPSFHWGNFVQVTAGDPDDVDRWLAVFADEFPAARYVAIGLPRMPAGGSWQRAGIAIETDESLFTRRLPEQRALSEGYTVRQLDTADDWDQVVRAGMADNAATGEHDPQLHEVFLRAQAEGRRDLMRRGHAAFFGAFDGHQLVSELGIVLLGITARYQSVGTREAHRRRGLAGHLLGVAARWAAERGAHEWVIATETTNEAGRLYRSVGFAPDVVCVSAYRLPTR